MAITGFSEDLQLCIWLCTTHNYALKKNDKRGAAVVLSAGKNHVLCKIGSVFGAKHVKDSLDLVQDDI